jgi:protein-L-isoaspartate(D-aspartate) O-methyltransferase
MHCGGLQLASMLLVAAVLACNSRRRDGPVGATASDPPEARALRLRLVDALSPELHSERVRDALRRVPRHLFAPSLSLAEAYADRPQPIGMGQTISQPLIVGLMTQALDLEGSEHVLEIGTGSGYQAAVLSVLAAQVDSIEIVPSLGESARARLQELGYENVMVRIGDGYGGWPERAPFERIILTAAPREVPQALFDQLALGGVLVAPVHSSPWEQRLLRYTKTSNGIRVEDLGGVRFVPMVPGG